MSHLGRVKEKSSLKNTLLPVSIRLNKLLNKNLIFIDEEAINNLKKSVKHD